MRVLIPMGLVVDRSQRAARRLEEEVLEGDQEVS